MMFAPCSWEWHEVHKQNPWARSELIYVEAAGTHYERKNGVFLKTKHEKNPNYVGE
jgi:hypothetical protein